MRVSVCIPCFNAERYITATLDSVLAQTYNNIEVVVTDDGSTDGSAHILADYRSRGVIIVSQSNRGQCAAANAAYARSTGDLIKFFDADDVMAPDHISLQVARLNGRRDAIAMGEWTRFYGNLPGGGSFERLPMYRDAAPVDWLTSEWLGSQPMMQCGLWLIPRSIVDRAGGWDERLSLINDFEFFTRVLLAAKEILFTPGARLFYRSGLPGSLSNQKSRQAVESQFFSLMLGTGHLLAVENSSRTRRACANVLKAFDYEHYPMHSDLRRDVRNRVTELGGSDLSPSGPPGFLRLRPWIGWKAARRLQRAAERFGLNSIARQRTKGLSKPKPCV